MLRSGSICLWVTNVKRCEKYLSRQKLSAREISMIHLGRLLKGNSVLFQRTSMVENEESAQTHNKNKTFIRKIMCSFGYVNRLNLVRRCGDAGNLHKAICLFFLSTAVFAWNKYYSFRITIRVFTINLVKNFSIIVFVRIFMLQVFHDMLWYACLEFWIPQV